MLLEELLDLRFLVALAEGRNRTGDPRNALEHAQQLGQRVPVRFDERPRRVARPGSSHQTGDQRRCILRANGGRDRKLERPLHERGIAERRKRIEEAVVLLGFIRQLRQLRDIAVVKHRVAANGCDIQHR
jgi:hypothetical protein